MPFARQNLIAWERAVIKNLLVKELRVVSLRHAGKPDGARVIQTLSWIDSGRYVPAERLKHAMQFLPLVQIPEEHITWIYHWVNGVK